MPLFSSKPALQLPPTMDIRVSDELRNCLPDPGALLLDLYPSAVQELVAAELDRVRFPSGGYDTRRVEFHKKAGPLYLLSWITAGDWISVQVWATLFGLGRGQKRDIKDIVAQVCKEQGVPAAASWVLQARSSGDGDSPRITGLADMLSSAYSENMGKLTNGMLSDSIQKWRR